MKIKNFLFLSTLLIGHLMGMAPTAPLPQVLFSQKEGSQATGQPNDSNIIAHIVTLIDKEQEKIDGALYDLTNPTIIAALQAAVTRGVPVSILMDSSNYAKHKYTPSAYPFIRSVKYPAGLMHEKFLLFYKNTIDVPAHTQQVICYGSWNPSNHKTCSTCDEFIIDNNPTIIETFKKEIAHLEALIPATAAPATATPAPATVAITTLTTAAAALTLHSTAAPAAEPATAPYPQILFSPEKRFQMPTLLCTLINTMHSCKSAMTWFSNVEVADKLYKAATTVPKKEVCLIVDKDSFAKSNIAWRVPNSFVYTGPEKMMHHKFFLFTFDSKPSLLWSGSWNCSDRVVNCDCVVLRDDSITTEFKNRFDTLKKLSLRSVTAAAFTRHALTTEFTKNQRYFDYKKHELTTACSDVPATELALCIQNFLGIPKPAQASP